MAHVRSLPKRDSRYDAFRAKMSILQILQARGYNLGKEEDMIDVAVGLREGYERFQDQLDELSRIETEKKANALNEVRVDLPSDTTYLHPRGVLSPLTVIFLASTSVNARLNSMTERIRSNARRSAHVSHFLFVVDKPRELTRSDSELLGNNTLEILPYQRLLFNPVDHYRSPTKIEILSHRRKDELLSSPGIVGRTLPIVQPIDPVVLFYDIKPGDVYRISDTRAYTGQNSSYITYRQAPRAITCVAEGCNENVYAFRTHYCRSCLTLGS